MGVKQGIYLAVVHDGNFADIQTRIVVVATDAAEAEHLAAETYGGTAAKRAALLGDNRIEIGRLGDYDPGGEGARLARTRVVAIQRPPV